MSGNQTNKLAANLGPWEISMQRFLQDLPPEDRGYYVKKSADKIRQDIETLKEQTDSMSWMARMKPLCYGLQGLDYVVTPLAGLDSHGVVAIIWGSVKVFLLLAQKSAAFFEQVERFLSDIGGELGRLRKYESLFKQRMSQSLQASLERVFTSYLVFCRRARDLYFQSSSRRFYESIGLTRTKSSNKIPLAIEEVRNACSNAIKEVNTATDITSITQNDQIQSSIDQLDRKMEDLGKDFKSGIQKISLREYLAWLRHEDMDDPLLKLSHIRKPGTCDWIFTNDEISQWLASKGNSQRVLWLTANAGFGKSVLSAYVVEQLQQLYPTGVAWFFCSHDQPRRRTLVDILRSWVHQLLQKVIVGKTEARGHFDIPDSALDFENAKEPTIAVMCRVVRKLFEQNKPVRLILDGLDECGVPVRAEEHDWDQFFALLESMPPDWKVLVVSRSNNWFNGRLLTKLRKMLSHVELESTENSEDIHQYVLEEVEKVSKYHQWGNQIKKEVIVALLEKANGMFVWVSLLCSILEEDGDGFDEDHIRTIINDLPKDLAELYGRSLKNLPKGGGLGQKMRLALRWTLCAYRPMTIKQLEAALPYSSALEETMKRNIGTLIRIDQGSKEVHLCHASARDYLYSPEAALFDDEAMSEPELVASTHSVLLNRCLQCLCSPELPGIKLPENRTGAEEHLRKFLHHYPLVDYSCISWVQHLRSVWRVDHEVRASRAMLNKFLGSDQPMLLWLQIFHFQWNMNYPGTDNTNKAISNLAHDDPKPDTWKQFLRNNYAEFVDHLSWEDGGRFTRWDRFTHRRHGFNFRHPYRLFQSPTCMSTTSVAAFFNYSTALESMAKGGENLDAEEQLGGTPLIWAATGSACKSIKVLLAAKADIEAGYNPEMKETPIFRALRVPLAVRTKPGSFPAATLLFEAGAKLKHLGYTNGFLDGTALIALIESNQDSKGAAEFAKMILQKDECWKWFDVRYATPLHAAAHHGRPLILEALLKDEYLRKRVNFQGSDTRLKAALHDACSSGNPVCVEELLKAGADPNLPSYLNGFTPLHYSVLSSHKAASTLLKAGADPNLRDRAKACPIHLATAVDVPLNVQEFVDKGYNIDALDGNGDTALSIALKNGNLDIAKQMLAQGADVEKVPSNFQIHLPANVTDDMLLQIRKRNWKPMHSYAYLSAFRQAFAKHGLILPIPIFGRVLDFLGHRDILKTTRKGRLTVNEAMVKTMSRPYITSPPIFGNYPHPVQELEFRVLGQCQDFGGQHDHSYYEIDTIDGATQKSIRWLPHQSRFGHNSRPLAEKFNIFTRERSLNNERFRLLKPGDRVAIVPWVEFSGWENSTERASIKMWLKVLRTYYTKSEKEQIWGRHEDDFNPTFCTPGRCVRCVAERILPNPTH